MAGALYCAFCLAPFWGSGQDLCPSCYEQKIIHSKNSIYLKDCPICLTKLYDVEECNYCDPKGYIAAKIVFNKKAARALELNSGVQEKLDFGGIKLVPEIEGYTKYTIKSKPFIMHPFVMEEAINYTEYNDETGPMLSKDDILAAVKLLKEASVPFEYYEESVAQFQGEVVGKNYIQYNSDEVVQNSGNSVNTLPVYDDIAGDVKEAVKTPYPNQAAAESWGL